MFQLRFYALVVWRMTGELPALLQLTYLGSGEYLRLVPDADDLRAFETKVRALWESDRGDIDSGIGNRNRRGCATGAPSRPCARRKAANRCRCRRVRCLWRRGAHSACRR